VEERLQTCIRKVTNHDKSFELELIGNVRWDQCMDIEAPIVWHEPILDRYWDQLEELIKQQDIVTDIERINFENVEMKMEHIAALVAILSSGRAISSSAFILSFEASGC